MKVKPRIIFPRQLEVVEGKAKFSLEYIEFEMSEIYAYKGYKCGCGTWEQGWKRGEVVGL